MAFRSSHSRSETKIPSSNLDKNSRGYSPATVETEDTQLGSNLQRSDVSTGVVRLHSHAIRSSDPSLPTPIQPPDKITKLPLDANLQQRNPELWNQYPPGIKEQPVYAHPKGPTNLSPKSDPGNRFREIPHGFGSELVVESTKDTRRHPRLNAADDDLVSAGTKASHGILCTPIDDTCKMGERGEEVRLKKRGELNRPQAKFGFEVSELLHPSSTPILNTPSKDSKPRNRYDASRSQGQLQADNRFRWSGLSAGSQLGNNLPFPSGHLDTHKSGRVSQIEKALSSNPVLHEVMKLQQDGTNSVFPFPENSSKLVTDASFHEKILVEHGYPENDQDVDRCLEDMPGLSKENYERIRSALTSHLLKVRQDATLFIGQHRFVMLRQSKFRAIGTNEMDSRLNYTVGQFCKARKHVLLKFREYVSNRKRIENVATRQRRGCLTHRQNNYLRLWLFSNFNNPYPDPSDKKQLTENTNLSLTQINNWLINARSRVWKPTVEIMSSENASRIISEGKDLSMLR